MKLEINGITVQLGNSTPAITRKSIDINDPSSRFLDFTNRFDLPDSNEVRELFDSPGKVGSNNRSHDKLYDVIIRDLTILFRGKGFLAESTTSKYAFQVVDNSKELFKSLEIKLNQINWDDKDTLLTTAQIDALDSADIDNCWFWGKACYHVNALRANTDQVSGGGDARCKYSRPAFYVQGLFNRALTQHGYTFTASGQGLAFSSNHKDFFFTSYQKTITATYNPSGTLALSGLDTNDFEHADLTTASTTIAIGTKKTKFRVRGTISSNATISLIVRATDDIDGTKITESKFVLPQDSSTVDFTSSEFQSDNGMTIDIRFEGTGQVDFTGIIIYTLLSEEYEDLSANPWLGYKIKAYDNLPDLTYLDLFRLICVTSNQYQVVDTFNKTFSFGSLSTFDKMKRKDWSDRYVNKSETITAKFEGLFQKNFLKYTNDLTVRRELGWHYFLTDNESLQAEGDYIVLNFGASDETTINSNDVVHLQIYNDTTRIIDQEINIRLFAINADKLQFSPVAWENISNNYYADWFNSLFRIRVIECEMDLKKTDVLKWREDDLVYIGYFGSTFHVLEINNFIPKRKTMVTLLNYGR